MSQPSKRLVMFDVSGIQSFIFSTPKVKEIIGASFLVENILETMLKKFAQTFVSEYNTAKQVHIAFYKVYVGGGNALYDLNGPSETVCQEFINAFVMAFKKEILENTNTLTVVAASVVYNEDDTYTEVLSALRLALSKAKNRDLRHGYFEGEPLFDVRPGTGKGIVNKKQQSDLNRIKMEAFDAWKGPKSEGSSMKKLMDRLLSTNNSPNSSNATPTWVFLDSFDDFVDKNKDSYLGIVHIDGNQMGQVIKEIMGQMDPKMTFEDAKTFHRQLSEEITETFESATIEGLERYQQAKKGETCAIRPIVFAGDDITFVCKASEALDMSIYILEAVSEKIMRGYPMSACGGIAYIKSHYPFDRAYELSESLCKNAKKSVKAHNDLYYKTNPASAIDYHLHYNGLETDIESIREREYPYMLAPIPLLIAPKTATSHLVLSINQIKDALYILQDPIGGISESKLKSLRQELFRSIEAGKLKVKDYSDQLATSPESKEVLRAMMNMDQNRGLALSCIELYGYYKPESGVRQTSVEEASL